MLIFEEFTYEVLKRINFCEVKVENNIKILEQKVRRKIDRKRKKLNKVTRTSYQSYLLFAIVAADVL